MFWIILSVIFLALVIIYRFLDEYEDYDVMIGWIIIFVISLIPLFIAIGDGITDYSALVSKYKSIETYRSRIIDVRNAYYETKKSGVMVAGSIENMQQSSRLSDYISNLASIESDYFSYLQKCKISKEMFVYKFFGTGLFISDRIYELPTK